MKYYIRKTDELINIKDNKSLIFLYKTIPGRIILKLITKPIFSKPMEKLTNTKTSKIYIKRFIKNNNIKITDYEKKEYESFNDFFTRKVKKSKRNQRSTKKQLISPCDSKITIYKIDDKLTINVKNSKYTIESLIKEKPSKEFKNGICIVLRLSVEDYHRYHAFDNYEVLKNKKIKGLLHTVNPISYENYKVFTENQREVSLLKTENFKEVYQIEVGALNIGKIHNKKETKYKKYDERGYFSFGGSTIVLLFQKDTVKIDKDIENWSKKNIEVKVEYGDVIGHNI
ncbi:MAG: phosphatidylserine decarboxylase [Bacilli bacterium]